MISIAILASLAFIGWLIYRAVRGKSFEAHVVTYAVACLAGIFTVSFFLSMRSIPEVIKIVVSILLGVVLIVVAAYLLQRRSQPGKP